MTSEAEKIINALKEGQQALRPTIEQWLRWELVSNAVLFLILSIITAVSTAVFVWATQKEDEEVVMVFSGILAGCFFIASMAALYFAAQAFFCPDAYLLNAVIRGGK